MSAITGEMIPSDNQTKAGVDGDPEFDRLKREVTAGHRQRSKWREEAKMAYDFVASRQWSEDDKKILADQHRPAVTFNRVAPIVKAVCGLEVNNRQDIVYLPREQTDEGVNESITYGVKWIRDENNAPAEESKAFRDLAICGEGWTETRMEQDAEGPCPIVEERIDPLEMGVNAGSYRANHDGSWLRYRVRDLEANEAEAMFGAEYNAEQLHADWMEDMITPADGGIGNKKDYPDKTRDGVGKDGRRKICRVVHVQWWQREDVVMVAQEGQQELQELSPEDYAKFQERAAAAGIVHQAETTKKKCYYEAFLGQTIIGKKKLPMNRFQFQAMTGEYDRELKCFYGLLRDMFDPQRWANKFLAQTMNIMNHNAKGGLLAERGAFDNVRNAERDWADPTKIVWTKDGKLDKVRDRNPPPMPQGLGDLLTFAISSIRDVSGINLELLGQADREQAAALELQRRQSAMTILATLFDSLRSYKINQGRLLLYFLYQLPQGTLVRVLDKGHYKYIPLIKDKSVAAYDVVVDEAPASPNQKQMIWQTTRDLLGSGIEFPPQVIAVLLEYSPYPESVVKDIRDAMGLGEELPAAMLKQKLDQAEQALQVMEQKLKEEMEKAKEAQDSSKIDGLKTLIEGYRAETERLAAEWKAELDVKTAVADAEATPGPLEGGGAAGPAAPEESVEDNGVAELKSQLNEMAGVLQQLVAYLQGGPQAAPQQIEENTNAGA